MKRDLKGFINSYGTISNQENDAPINKNGYFKGNPYLIEQFPAFSKISPSNNLEISSEKKWFRQTSNHHRLNSCLEQINISSVSNANANYIGEYG